MKYLQIKISEPFSRLSFLLLFAVLACSSTVAQKNPVVERVADAGVISFNGKYYLGGVSTRGGFYISSDLVNWKGPLHAFSMSNEWTHGRSAGDENIHASDIHYWNGRFHLYWSVNSWGFKDMVVHIGHAESDNILGPYVEPEKKTWFDDRIDAELFIDDDSSFYFYSVKFTDGNTIWGQRMKDPATHLGEPGLICTALPNTWEQFDNKVIEGPWVFKYRNNYYMMYNANHTSNQYGNYALGVAQSDSPLGFSSGNKYPWPVVHTNMTDNPESFRYYFTSSEENFKGWKFTTEKPAENWLTDNFDDSRWHSGDKGFTSQEVRGSKVIRKQTEWTSQEIWTRKKFILDPAPSKNLQLLVNHSGPADIYIDGNKVYSGQNGNYARIDLLPEVISGVSSGEHTFAMHSSRGRRSSYLDTDLVDPLDGNRDDILFNPGQPNIVKGPNGFEWWLVYFGIKNSEPRGQFVNRVLFNDRELTVDGPTGPKTSGYHPGPSLPVFGDVFDYKGADTLNSRWKTLSGKWDTENGEMKQREVNGRSLTVIKSHKSSNFLFKAGVRNDSNNGKAGIIAYYLNQDNFLEIGFNEEEKCWYTALTYGKRTKITKVPLAKEFNYNVYHSISACKNGNTFTVLIDDNPAPGNNRIDVRFSAEGIAGLYSEGCMASFDGVIYTPGWDEYDGGIEGWESQSKVTKSWVSGSHGISPSDANGTSSVFKGDLLDQYEFGAQVYNGSSVKASGYCGVFPVYADDANYIRAEIDFSGKKLEISGKKGNEEIPSQTIPLRKLKCLYPDPKYGDGFAKVYTLKKNTEISSLEIVKSIYERETFRINQFDSLKVFYWKEGTWRQLQFRNSSPEIENINRIEFSPVTTNAIRLVSSASDNSVHVYKVYATEEVTSDYNIRSIKLKDRVLIYLDGQPVAEVKGQWPASRVGIISSNTQFSFNGITLFEKN
jgi:GH43 family beta-xylosidase